MSKQIEALKMAIKALQNISKSLTEKQVWFSSDVYDAIQACKEALEQPTTQELYDNGGNMTITTQSLTHVIGLDSKGYEAVVKLQSPLYTHPKEWQGLSDDDLAFVNNLSDYEFARAIEAKLKEKNT